MTNVKTAQSTSTQSLLMEPWGGPTIPVAVGWGRVVWVSEDADDNGTHSLCVPAKNQTPC